MHKYLEARDWYVSYNQVYKTRISYLNLHRRTHLRASLAVDKWSRKTNTSIKKADWRTLEYYSLPQGLYQYTRLEFASHSDGHKCQYLNGQNNVQNSWSWVGWGKTYLSIGYRILILAQMTGTARDALSVKSSIFDLKFFSWCEVKTCVFGSLLDQ
jgi:hypothetical protein